METEQRTLHLEVSPHLVFGKKDGMLSLAIEHKGEPPPDSNSKIPLDVIMVVENIAGGDVSSVHTEKGIVYAVFETADALSKALGDLQNGTMVGLPKGYTHETETFKLAPPAIAIINEARGMVSSFERDR